MTCPFGYGSSLRQAQQLDKQLQERNGEAGNGVVSVGAQGTPSPSPAPSSSASPLPASASPATTGSPASLFSPPVNPNGAPHLPLSLWTGGMRTSLGVENAHPVSVWMKEMQARGGLKGIDIEKELMGFHSAGAGEVVPGQAAQQGGMHPEQSQLEQLDDIARANAEKNWKQKRERPPIELGGTAAAPAQAAAAPAAAVPTDGTSNPTHPSLLHLYPGALSTRMDHNSHAGQNPMSKYDQEITYWNYIHPEVLTSLQCGRQGKGLNSHDEHLFILVHQTFELWFKQILWEMEYVRNVLIGFRDPLLPALPVEINPLARCVQRMKRADKILRLATEGYAIMETMDPADFLEFRDFLSPSSGFQSVQLREIEIMLGLKDEERLACAGRHYREAFMANGDNKTPIFDARLAEHSLKDGLYVWLRSHPPSERMSEFLAAYFDVIQTQNVEKSKDFEEEIALLNKMKARTTDPREVGYLDDLAEKARFGRTLARNSTEDVRAFFADPLLGPQRASILYLFTFHTHNSCILGAELVNSCILFEQAVILWRQRHARMVEMFIGRRPGTGGSSGVEYIDNTAQQYRIFTDLWRIRSLCVARTKLNFDPDRGAITYKSTTEQLSTDLPKVNQRIKEDTQRIKAEAKAQKAHKAKAAAAAEAAAAAVGGVKVADDVHAAAGEFALPSSVAHALANGSATATAGAAAGDIANSTTSIAAGIGPGASVGSFAS